MDYDDYQRQCELEARLYSRIHHENVSNRNQSLNQNQQRQTAQSDQSSSRNNRRNQRHRYWNDSPNNQRPVRPSNMRQPWPPENQNWGRNQRSQDRQEPQQQQQQHQQQQQQQRNKKFLMNPFNDKARRMERALQKRSRHQRFQKLQNFPDFPKLQTSQQAPKQDNVIFVEEDDSQSEFKVPPPPNTTAKRSVEAETEEDDDVILIPAVPPEVVVLEDDSESEEPENDVPPPASRPHSPSSSSMMSDDFIERTERTRIRGVEPSRPTPSTSNVEKSPLSVSSASSEDNSMTYDDEPQPSTSSSFPIQRGPALDNNLANLKRQPPQKPARERTKSFNKDNFNEGNFISVLTDIIRNEEEESDSDDGGVDHNKAPPGVAPPSDEEAMEQEEDNASAQDIQLNVTQNEEADIADAMPEEPVAGPSSQLVKVPTGGWEIGWNEEMHKFYNNSWGGEDFNISRVLKPMPRDPKHWQIDIEDRYPPPSVKMPRRCQNCQEFSHRVQNCPLPRRKIVCFVCGQQGHREPRCPRKMCLNCGASSNVFMRHCQKCTHERQKRCSLCQVKGHVFYRCPDKWRRYHNTTRDFEELNQETVSNPRKWCSVCAEEGHLANNCHHAQRVFGHNLPKMSVTSYLPVFPLNVNEEEAPREPISYNLMSFSPDFEVIWDQSIKKEQDGFYDRFCMKNNLIPPKKRFDDELEARNEPEAIVLPDSEDDGEAAGPLESSAASESDPSSFSFTKELQKVNEEREFHIDLDDSVANSDSDVPFDPPIFENKQEELRKTSDTFGMAPEVFQQSTAEHRVAFPVDFASDYIALDEEAPQEPKTVAKVLLTKTHSSWLLTFGTVFLQEMSKKYDVEIRMAWERVGNMLVIGGSEAKQNAVHEELKKFLKTGKVQESERRIYNSFSLPKNREKLIVHVKERLKSLQGCTKSFRELKEIVHKLKVNMSNKSWRAAEKQRVILNMHFFGRFGLREGKEHMLGIARLLDELQKRKDLSNQMEVRKTMQDHLVFIFSATNHNAYHDLLDELSECNKAQSWPLSRDQVFSFDNLLKLAKQPPPPVTDLFFIDTQPTNENESETRTPDSTTKDDEAAPEAAPEDVDMKETPPESASENPSSSAPTTSKQAESEKPSSSRRKSTDQSRDAEVVASEKPSKARRKSMDPQSEPESASSTRRKSSDRTTPEPPSKGRRKSADLQSEPESSSDRSKGSKRKSKSGESASESTSEPEKSAKKRKTDEERAPKPQKSPKKQPENSEVSPPNVKEEAPVEFTLELKPNDEVSSSVEDGSENFEHVESSETLKMPDFSGQVTYLERARDIIRQAEVLFKMMNNTAAVQKLNQVKQKADNGRLTQEDYQSLLQIHSIVQSKLNEPL